MKWRVLAVAVLLVLAGCNGGGDTTSPAPVTTTGGGEATGVTTTTSTTVTPTKQNPWRTDMVTISVDTAPYTNESYRAAVREAASFWEEHVDETPYTFEFEVVPDATAPDIRVDYQTAVETCGGEPAAETYFWCTDTYEDGETERGTSEVEVAGRYTPNATVRIVKQAFADLLGVPDAQTVAGLEEVDSPLLRDPWPRAGAVVVGINQSVTPRNMTPLVRAAVDYWETTGAKYANYTTDFVVRPDASNPDVVVEFTKEIETCGIETGAFLGCAPLLDTSTLADDRETIRIETGYTDASTLSTLKHEFGHFHGLEHGEEPMPLMNSTYDATRLPMPNATERANPWMQDSLLVYVDYESFSGDRDRVQEQVQHALTYYSAGADGYAPAELSVTLTRNASEADIDIRSGDIEGDDGSIGDTWGMNLDGDSALEYYTNQTITIEGLPTEVVGWHVGYWLATSITSDDDPAVLPPPFQDADYDDRRNWWRQT